MAATRLRAVVRLREAVAASAEPQLQRGQDDDLRERDYSTEQRIQLAKQGHAIPVKDEDGEIIDGRYPIETRDDVGNAVRDADRTGADADVLRHILANAQRLGAESEIPEAWPRRIAGVGEFSPKRQKPTVGKKRSKGNAQKKTKGKAKPARESVSFVARLHEAEVTKAAKGCYEATIVREGPGNQGDRNFYSRSALRDAVAGGLFEGLQCYANHPTPSEERERPERDVRQLVGHFKEARYVEEGGRAAVRAKFVPIQGPGYEWVTSLIESALNARAGKPLIGISIDGHGHAPDTKEIDGQTYHVVREITHLGSADMVTKAGAGGQFHRRLSESLAGAQASRDATRVLGANEMQRLVRKAIKRLEKASRGDGDGIEAAVQLLADVGGAKIQKPKKQRRARESAGATRLRAKARKAQKRRRLAEARAELADRATLAGRLLREVDVSPRTREAWLDDLIEQKNEKRMRAVLQRRQAERQDQLGELREALGLDRVEGCPPRGPSTTPTPTDAGLFSRLGLDEEEYAA